MDVTPQELRDIEIREAWRGYHRDDVDELLERAAATIEHLDSQIRLLQDRLAAAPARATAPEPVAPARPEPEPRAPVPDSDIIQRTLLLAQKAADEAVAEAQARAQHLMSESEAKAQALVSEAESTARRIAESERRRIEAEIQQLTNRRDSLLSDVEALDRFEDEYRDRIKRAVESELDRLLERASIPAPDRPELVTTSYGSALAGSTLDREPIANAPLAGDVAEPAPWSTATPDPTPTPSLTPSPTPDREPEPEPPLGAGADAPTEAHDTSTSAWDRAVTPGGTDGGPGGEPKAAAPEPSRTADAQPPLDALDDDAFFASLREAVRDDAPLGPRGDDFYDDEDAEGGRKLFRRRR